MGLFSIYTRTKRIAITKSRLLPALYMIADHIEHIGWMAPLWWLLIAVFPISIQLDQMSQDTIYANQSYTTWPWTVGLCLRHVSRSVFSLLLFQLSYHGFDFMKSMVIGFKIQFIESVTHLSSSMMVSTISPGHHIFCPFE